MAGFSMTVINYKSIRSQAFPPRGCGWSSCAGPIPFGLGSLAPRSPLRRRPIGGSGWPSSPGRLALRPASAESACRRGPGRRRCRRAFAPGSVCASGRTCPGSQKAGRPGPGQGSAGRSVPCMSVPRMSPPSYLADLRFWGSRKAVTRVPSRMGRCSLM